MLFADYQNLLIHLQSSPGPPAQIPSQCDRRFNACKVRGCQFCMSFGLTVVSTEISNRTKTQLVASVFQHYTSASSSFASSEMYSSSGQRYSNRTSQKGTLGALTPPCSSRTYPSVATGASSRKASTQRPSPRRRAPACATALRVSA